MYVYMIYLYIAARLVRDMESSLSFTRYLPGIPHTHTHTSICMSLSLYVYIHVYIILCVLLKVLKAKGRKNTSKIILAPIQKILKKTYHLTITYFWMQLVHYHIAAQVSLSLTDTRTLSLILRSLTHHHSLLFIDCVYLG